MNKMLKLKLPAFTLIEILLAVALLAMILAISLPLGQEYLNKNELENAKTLITQTIRSAQANAKAGKADAQWGVRINDNAITLFQGNSYATRNTSVDVVITWSDRFDATGVSELVFSKYNALPSTTGTITITGFELTSEITINTQGNLLY